MFIGLSDYQKESLRSMNRMIISMKDKYLETSAQFVEGVFTDSEGKKSAKIVKQLVLEIRSKRFYLPTVLVLWENKRLFRQTKNQP